jgi:nucleotide-binding universal stress UspA family protein
MSPGVTRGLAGLRQKGEMEMTSLTQTMGQVQVRPTSEEPSMLFKRMLVPLDGSELSERALPFAQALACTLRADLILARVAGPGRPGGGEAEGEGEGKLEAAVEAQRYLQGLAGDYRTNYAVEYSVPFGDPAEEIPRVAEVRAADLVVMATHGRSGFPRLFLGSVTEALVRQTQLPLLLVRGDLPMRRWEHGPRRILVPLDGSELAERALNQAAALAEAARAQLTLLQVVGPVMPELRSFEVARLPEDDEALADLAEGYLRRVAAPLVGRGLEVQTVVVRGTPGEQIAATAAAGYDLIAMATHGRGGIERLIVGSVADQVVRTADVPVLLVRA